MDNHVRQGISEPVALPPADIMECIVVTPEATVRDGSAQFVALPLFDGEIGILPLHANMIGRLGFGEMRIMEGGKTDRFFVDGGFVQVLNNIIYVLTNRAIPADKVDAEAAREQLAAARARPAHTPELQALRDRFETQARAQLRVAQRAHGGSSSPGH
jgi:F-type H+-transporting ATPase subunit epsilon